MFASSHCSPSPSGLDSPISRNHCTCPRSTVALHYICTPPPPCSTGWVTERLHFFTFASARCLLSHRQDQFPSTGELGESTDPTAHEYITVIVLPLLSTQVSPCSYSSSIVLSAFWNFSVFGFPFRPVLYHDTLTAARSNSSSVWIPIYEDIELEGNFTEEEKKFKPGKSSQISKCSAGAGSKASLRRPQSRSQSHHPHPFAILEFRNVAHQSQPVADLRLPQLPTRWWIRLAGGSSSSPAGGSTENVSSMNHANKSIRAAAPLPLLP